MKREIEIISKDKRYRMFPYPSVPAFSGQLNTYLTGQHIDPDEPRTRNFLTVDEMTKKKELKDKKLELFPYSSIINPEDVTLIKHREKLDITPIDESKDGSIYPADYVNPYDFARWRYFQYQEVVAKSEEEYNPSKHYFILVDKEAVIKSKLSKRDIKYAAEKFIRESVTVEEYRNIALLLNYKVPSLNINVNLLTESEIKIKLFDVVESNPEKVLLCDANEYPFVKQELFILRLIDQKKISYNNGVYFDGRTPLGTTIAEILSTLSKNENLYSKLARMSNYDDGTSSQVKQKPVIPPDAHKITPLPPPPPPGDKIEPIQTDEVNEPAVVTDEAVVGTEKPEEVSKGPGRPKKLNNQEGHEFDPPPSPEVKK